MKFFIESILLGLGLAMDASCVAMTNGLKYPKQKLGLVIITSLMFAFFQALMPFLGYVLGSQFQTILGKFTPWIALLLLGAIGIKMLIDGIKYKKEDNIEDVTSNIDLKTILLQAIATAIDALSVGVVLINYSPRRLLATILIIAIVTFFLSFASFFLGKKFGNLLNDKAEIIGGIILIAIGLEIFISGVFF